MDILLHKIICVYWEMDVHLSNIMILSNYHALIAGLIVILVQAKEIRIGNYKLINLLFDIGIFENNFI